MELQVPSIRWSLIAGMVYAARWCFSMNPKSMNESEDSESTRDINGISGIDSEVTRIMRACRLIQVPPLSARPRVQLGLLLEAR